MSRLQSVMNARRSAYLLIFQILRHHSLPASAPLAEGSGSNCFRVCTVQSWCTKYPRVSTLRASYLIDEFCEVADVEARQRLAVFIFSSSAAPDCRPSATKLFRSPLLVSGTVCLNTSPPQLIP